MIARLHKSPTTPGATAEASPPAARGARVFPIPPPLYYGAAFATGKLLHGAIPLDVPARPISTIIGVSVVVAGLALDMAGVATVIGHRTTMVPHRPVTKLITSGIYRFTRNPMYTGLALMVAGGGLVAGTWWPLLLLLLALLAVRWVVIEPEEAYLAATYGSAYADYKSRVRRWLGASRSNGGRRDGRSGGAEALRRSRSSRSSRPSPHRQPSTKEPPNRSTIAP